MAGAFLNLIISKKVIKVNGGAKRTCWQQNFKKVAKRGEKSEKKLNKTVQKRGHKPVVFGGGRRGADRGAGGLIDGRPCERVQAINAAVGAKRACRGAAFRQKWNN
jgi:hypothetical protein